VAGAVGEGEVLSEAATKGEDGAEVDPGKGLEGGTKKGGAKTEGFAPPKWAPGGSLGLLRRGTTFHKPNARQSPGRRAGGRPTALGEKEPRGSRGGAKLKRRGTHGREDRKEWPLVGPSERKHRKKKKKYSGNVVGQAGQPLPPGECPFRTSSWLNLDLRGGPAQAVTQK